MEKYDIDALVATTPENNFYISELQNLGHWVLRDVNVFTIFPRDGEPTIILPRSDVDIYAESSSWISNMVCYGTFFIELPETEELMAYEKQLAEFMKLESKKLAIDALVEVLKDQNLDNKILGIDEGGITCTVWDELQNKLPAAKIRPSASIFREIRMVKTNDEIIRLKRAVEITERAFNAALQKVKEGTSEIELAREFEINVIKEGGSPFFTVIGFGNRSALPNAIPSSYRLKRGEIIRFDGGCIFQRYCSDIALTAVLGQPTEKHRKYYRAIVRGAKEAIESIRPGIKASEIFDTALKTTKNSGIPGYRRHHCGHGIGIEIYDIPVIKPTDNTPLEKGMVFCIETPYYEIGFGGLQIEKTVLVTEDGYEYLTTPTESEELLIL